MRREFTATAICIDEWLVDVGPEGARVIESG
jgi:hypothetical protein